MFPQHGWKERSFTPVWLLVYGITRGDGLDNRIIWHREKQLKNWSFGCLQCMLYPICSADTTVKCRWWHILFRNSMVCTIFTSYASLPREKSYSLSHQSVSQSCLDASLLTLWVSRPIWTLHSTWACMSSVQKLRQTLVSYPNCCGLEGEARQQGAWDKTWGHVGGKETSANRLRREWGQWRAVEGGQARGTCRARGGEGSTAGRRQERRRWDISGAGASGSGWGDSRREGAGWGMRVAKAMSTAGRRAAGEMGKAQRPVVHCF